MLLENWVVSEEDCLIRSHKRQMKEFLKQRILARIVSLRSSGEKHENKRGIGIFDGIPGCIDGSRREEFEGEFGRLLAKPRVKEFELATKIFSRSSSQRGSRSEQT